MDKKLNPSIGQRLHAARRKAGLTQKEMAERLGMDYVQSISKWENDRVYKISSDVFRAYSDASGYTMDYLQGFVDDPYKGLFVEYYAARMENVYRLLDYLSAVSPYTFERVDAHRPLFYIIDKESGETVRKLTERHLFDFCKSLNLIIDVALENMIEITSDFFAIEASKYNKAFQQSTMRYDGKINTITNHLHNAAIKKARARDEFRQELDDIYKEVEKEAREEEKNWERYKE